MDIKVVISKIFFGVVIIAFFCFCGCKKPCRKNNYNFKGTGLFSPEKDSIKIGDTLFFSSIINNQLRDTSSNHVIDYSSATNFATQINFDVASLADILNGAVDSFAFVIGKGSVNTNSLSPHSAKTVSYIEENGNYKLSFGIVALKKGNYVITIIDIANSKKNCSNAYIALTVSNMDQHLYYLNAVYFPGSPWGNSIPPIIQTHSYCFKVK